MNWGYQEDQSKRGRALSVYVDEFVYWPVYDGDVGSLIDWYEWQTPAPLEKIGDREYATREHCDGCAVNVRKGDWSMEFWRDNGEAYCNKCAEEVSDED